MKQFKRKWKRPQSVGSEIKSIQVKHSTPKVLKNDQVNQPTHQQVARLLSYLARPCHTSEILCKMRELVNSTKKGNDCKINSNSPKIGKNPIRWMQSILCDVLGTVSINSVPNIDLKT